MKKILFISNISNKITNFSMPSIIAAQNLGYEFHMAANYSNFKDDTSKYNISIHHIDIVRNPLSLKNIKAYKQMLELIEKEKFHAIHCNTPIGGLLGRLCGKKTKVPKIIYTAHGFHFYKGAPLINRTIFKWVEIWLSHYTDAIITINKEDYKNVQKFRLRKNGNVYYVPGVGIDINKIKKEREKREELLKHIDANNKDILVISVGELNRNKNNRVIIEALGKLRDKRIHYILCGTGEKKEELISLSKQFNIENNVHFLGYRSDIYELLKSCDIFVMPSYREGLSRALMEAMSAGMPCIVSKIRGNVDLIEEGKGGFLINPNDIDGFSKAIVNVIDNKELKCEMGVYNLKKIREFDVENIKEEMKKIYKKVLIEEKTYNEVEDNEEYD